MSFPRLLGIGSFLIAPQMVMACLSPSEMVATINFKSEPQMHVRHCEGRLSIPYPMDNQSFLTTFETDVFIPECEAEVLYQKIAVGTKVVGQAKWIERITSVDILGRNHTACVPEFHLTGVVQSIWEKTE